MQIFATLNSLHWQCFQFCCHTHTYSDCHCAPRMRLSRSFSYSFGFMFTMLRLPCCCCCCCCTLLVAPCCWLSWLPPGLNFDSFSRLMPQLHLPLAPCRLPLATCDCCIIELAIFINADTTSIADTLDSPNTLSVCLPSHVMNELAMLPHPQRRVFGCLTFFSSFCDAQFFVFQFSFCTLFWPLAFFI